MSTELQNAAMSHVGDGRRACRWLLGSAALVVALAVYCELCSVVTGIPSPGLGISAVWALRVSIGWIAVGAAFAVFGPRIAQSKFATANPRTLIAIVVFAVAAFTLLCEASIAYVREGLSLAGSTNSVLALLHARAPVSIFASALLTGIWMANQWWNAWPGRSATVALPANPVEAPVCDAQSKAGQRTPRAAADVMEVLTGAGHTTVRVKDIECFKADRNYITITHVSGRNYLLRRTMTTLERTLDPDLFVRIHRSTIVNRERVVERRCSGALVLKSGQTVQISRAYRKDVDLIDHR
ncbi:MAG: LytR/AlgR family response regulator transcription factor [Steroidobacter sp.]